MAEEKKIKQLPKDWKWVNLGDVCEIIMGQSPPSSTYNTGKIGLPFFQGKAEFTELHPIVEKWCSSPNKIAKANDILLSVRAPVGSTNVANQDCCIGRGLAAIRYKNWKYLFYFLNRIAKQLDEKGTGTTFKAISGETIRETKFPFPNETIQQAIVSKIEELFSELDKGIEQLKTAQQQLKIYRQVVLKWAFEGKLTNGNVKDGELPKKWTWVKSGDLFDFVTSGSRGWAKYYANSGAIFLRITNLDFDSLNLDLDDNKIQYVNPPANSEGIRTKVQEGDFLFSITGYLGMFAIAPRLENAFVNQHIALCRPKAGFNKQFMGYWIISKSGGYHYLNKMTKGATKAGLGLDDIKNFPVPIAPFEEQNKIVQEIESRLSVADKMEESINQSLKHAEALRQSILKKAFEGKLVASDTIETVKQEAKVIPLERKVLAGKIIHLLHDDKYFGLTKFQKILYLVENFSEVSYETNFIQERAGPYDKEFTIAFRKEMQEKDWLQEVQKGSITKFIAGDNIGSLIKDYAVYFREKGKQIVFVIQQLKDKSTHEAELIATLYAVWNNRLIKRKPVKIDLLVEDFFNWSTKKKEEFQPEEVVATFKWMKQIKFVPSGFGKVIDTD
jgi:type I restriction enzyme S subunit